MTRVAIVGTGFSGIGTAVALLREGVEVVLFERSDDVGGVWRDNAYPGAACDVPSHLYSFSWAPSAGWSRRFAPQAEIHAYLRRVAQEHGVLPHVRFRTEVVRAVWDGGAWDLELATGEVQRFDAVVTATGQLSRPALPDVPGLGSFAGPAFHSAQWRADVPLAGRRVAVLGTGASAVQFVPHVVREAAHVDVFQRSAPYVLPKPDRAYGQPFGPWSLKADRLRTYLTTEARSLGFNTEPRLLALHRARFLRHLARQVPDPALRAVLTPTDPIGCKRVLMSDDWYPALVQPHVDVVTARVTRVEPSGLRTDDGVLHEADVLVLGTGFAATDLVAPLEVVGRDGRTLRQAWAQGAEAHLGTLVHGFPNLFVLYGPNTNLGHSSIVLMLEAQIRYVTQAVRLLAHGPVEVREEVQRVYNEELQRRLATTVFATGCRSWYLTPDGRNTQNWPGTTLEFRLRTRRLRRDDLLPATVRQRVAA